MVDDSLAAAFARFRRPAMTAWLAGSLVVGVLSDWRLGAAPVVMAAIGAFHAAYEHRLPHKDPAIGLGIDILVLIGTVWLGGSAEAIMAFSMMFVVSVMMITDGRRRGILLFEIFAVAAFANTVPLPVVWPPMTEGLSRVIALQPIAVIVFVLLFATRELRNAEAQRGYVIGTVAHELRNDLTPVAGMSSMLTDELRAIGRHDLAEMATIVTSQATAATETIDDLLTMARIDREALGLNLGPIDVADAVAETLERYGLTGQIVPSVKSAQVIADPVRLRQIVRNLCTNAQRYGGDAVEVVVDMKPHDGCHILVKDDGPGIPDDDLVVVFEPFGRGSAGRRNGTSVGMGLWLSRQLAEAMNGELTYRRDQDWTVFDLRLPCTGAPTVADVPAPTQPAALHGS